MRILVEGEEAARAAGRLEAALEDGAAGSVTRETAASLQAEVTRTFDLATAAAVVSMILAIPPAIESVGNLIERMARRKRADAAIEAARVAEAEDKVSVYVVMADGSLRTLASLDADGVLAIWEEG